MEQKQEQQHRRGAFICFEGIDHSGKSTQARRVAERLAAEPGCAGVRVVTFPDRTSPTGVLINGYLTDKTKTLDDHVVHLLYAANRWEKMFVTCYSFYSSSAPFGNTHQRTNITGQRLRHCWRRV